MAVASAVAVVPTFVIVTGAVFWAKIVAVVLATLPVMRFMREVAVDVFISESVVGPAEVVDRLVLNAAAVAVLMAVMVDIAGALVVAATLLVVCFGPAVGVVVAAEVVADKVVVRPSANVLVAGVVKGENMVAPAADVATVVFAAVAACGAADINVVVDVVIDEVTWVPATVFVVGGATVAFAAAIVFVAIVVVIVGGKAMVVVVPLVVVAEPVAVVGASVIATEVEVVWKSIVVRAVVVGGITVVAADLVVADEASGIVWATVGVAEAVVLAGALAVVFASVLVAWATFVVV